MMDGKFASSNLSLVPTLDELIKILQYSLENTTELSLEEIKEI
jgi:hypothetical protein